MTEQGKSQIQTLAAGFLGFAGVIGLGSLVILHHGGPAAPGAVSVYAPVDAAEALAVPARVGKTDSSGAPIGRDAMASSPAPLLSDEIRADAATDRTAAAAGAAVAAGANSGAAPKLIAAQPLDSASSASSSAQASAGSAPKKIPPAKKPFAAPKLDLTRSQGTIASSVRYGVSDRSELMGRAAGPVLNFSGKSLGGQSAEVAAGSMDAAGAIQQVNDAQKKVDASDATSADKSQTDQNLNQVRQTVSAPVGQ
jgi:hypothetical protein